MKRICFTLFFCLPFILFAQQIEFKGNVYDGINFTPIEGANIYNYNTKEFVFSDEKGNFIIPAHENDTIIFTKSVYRQQLIVLSEEELAKNINEFFLYHKAIMLEEVTVYAFSSDYNTFLREVAEMKLDDAYRKIAGIEMTDEEKANIENANNKQGNLLTYTPLASPFTFFYEKFNKKYLRDKLAQSLFENEEEIAMLPLKYNRDLVTELTGLKGEDLLDFMVYCAFSYYDLIQWSPEVIEGNILQKFTDYEYYKLLEE